MPEALARRIDDLDRDVVDATHVDLGAERAGGHGRAYEIHFAVDDTNGNSASGTCRVPVPHDQRPGSAAVDSGDAWTVHTD